MKILPTVKRYVPYKPSSPWGHTLEHKWRFECDCKNPDGSMSGRIVVSHNGTAVNVPFRTIPDSEGLYYYPIEE